MRFRSRWKKTETIETRTTPLIDVVFLLLIFFMLSLKIVAKDGEHNLNMPPTPNGVCGTPPIEVKLTANEDGSLRGVAFNYEKLGAGEEAFQKLNQKIGRAIGVRNGKPLNEDVEVEIQADYNLDYQYAIRAFGACSGGREMTADGEARLVRYVEKIKFAPPQPPE